VLDDMLARDPDNSGFAIFKARIFHDHLGETAKGLESIDHALIIGAFAILGIVFAGLLLNRATTPNRAICGAIMLAVATGFLLVAAIGLMVL
jgi:hypothetical protein